jgi:hypothetical protein
VIAFRPHLRQTIRVALLIGTVIYLVPFGVSNYGILLATRSPAPEERR